MEREPVVAGIFYESRPKQLNQQLDALWPVPEPEKQTALGAMLPHAGYIYSGRTAAQVYARLAPAEVYVLLGPNHTGRGKRIAISEAASWKTPLGSVGLDIDLARQIIDQCPSAGWDNDAHETEHALEVQLPFLQKTNPSFQAILITVATHEIKLLRELGQAIANAIAASRKKCLILASSDMNHFEPLERTREVDHLALSRVLELDPEGLLRTVDQYGISMCGAAPTAAMLYAVKQLGASQAECVDYSTSAEVSRDTERVVGYAGVIVK